MKNLTIYFFVTIALAFCIFACTPSTDGSLEFPNALNDLKEVLVEVNIPADSSVIEMKAPGLVCNKWIKGSGTRCGLVADCEKYTYEEAKLIGDLLAASINNGTKDICKQLNCPKRQFRNVKWSVQSCNNRMLCIGVSYEFRCKN